MNLIVKMDPVQETEIYQITDKGMVLLCSYRIAQEAMQFIKDTIKENTDIIFIGPKTYTQHFIEQANKIEFVNATQG